MKNLFLAVAMSAIYFSPFSAQAAKCACSEKSECVCEKNCECEDGECKCHKGDCDCEKCHKH